MTQVKIITLTDDELRQIAAESARLMYHLCREQDAANKFKTVKLSVKQLSEMYGKSQSTIRRNIKEFGTAKRGSGYEATAEEFEKYYYPYKE